MFKGIFIFLFCFFPFILQAQSFSGKFTFEDTNLEYVVNQELPVRGKLSSLKILSAESAGIESDLKGLEYCTQLEVARLSDNRIYGLWPLRGAAQTLKYLDLSYNLLHQIEDIKYLKKLVYLNLASNQIKDIKPLQNLKKLVYLNLASNRIKSLKPLLKLHNLKYLDISFNPLSEKELQLLENFPKLEYLNISGSKCRDFSFLQKLTHLKKIGMQFMDLKKVPWELSKLPLVYVELQYNHLAEVKNLPSTIEELYLDFNQIQDVSYFPKLYPELKVLTLSYNKISNPSFLQSRQFKVLVLEGNPIKTKK